MGHPVLEYLELDILLCVHELNLLGLLVEHVGRVVHEQLPHSKKFIFS